MELIIFLLLLNTFSLKSSLYFSIESYTILEIRYLDNVKLEILADGGHNVWRAENIHELRLVFHISAIIAV